jgi:hypothetical protein
MNGPLIRELALRRVSAQAQISFPLFYKGQHLGEDVASGLRVALLTFLRQLSHGVDHQFRLVEMNPVAAFLGDNFPEIRAHRNGSPGSRRRQSNDRDILQQPGRTHRSRRFR